MKPSVHLGVPYVLQTSATLYTVLPRMASRFGIEPLQNQTCLNKNRNICILLIFCLLPWFGLHFWQFISTSPLMVPIALGYKKTITQNIQNFYFIICTKHWRIIFPCLSFFLFWPVFEFVLITYYFTSLYIAQGYMWPLEREVCGWISKNANKSWK